MPAEVCEVADAFAEMDRKGFGARYTCLHANKYFSREENWAKDQEYMHDLFIRMNRLKKFYRRAAQESRAVVFYTDDPLDMFFEPGEAP